MANKKSFKRKRYTKKNESGPAKRPMMTTVHHVRAFNCDTSKVIGLASGHRYVAVLRQSCVRNREASRLFVDVLRRCDGFPLVQRLHCQRQVDVLIWFGDRLFFGSTDGSVSELQAETGQVVNSAFCSGGAVWSLAVSTNNASSAQLLCGTEDGYVCFFDLESKDDSECRPILEPTTFKSWIRTEKRVLSLDISTTSGAIVAGSINFVVFWDGKRRPKHRLRMARSTPRDVFVWAVKWQSQSTAVSCDSDGRVYFWNANLGTMLGQFKVCQPALYSLCCSNDNVVFATGASGCIYRFESRMIQHNSAVSQWSLSTVLKDFKRPVRAIVSTDRDRVLAGGNDPFLLELHLDGSEETFPLPSTRPAMFSLFQHASKDNKVDLILYGRLFHLELWIFPSGCQEPPVKLAEIRPPAKNGQFEAISSFAISSNGKLVAYSTMKRWRCLSVSYSSCSAESELDQDFSVTLKPLARVSTIDSSFSPSPAVVQRLCFADDVLYCSRERTIARYERPVESPDSIHLVNSINIDANIMQISTVQPTSRPQFLAVTTFEDCLLLFSKELQLLSRITCSRVPLDVFPLHSSVGVLYPNGIVRTVDSNDWTVDDFQLATRSQPSILSTGCVYLSSVGRLLVYNSTGFSSYQGQFVVKSNAKKRRLDSGSVITRQAVSFKTVAICPKNLLSFLCRTANRKLLAVEFSAASLVANLGKVAYRNVFNN